MPKRTDIKSILIIGAGPIVIGQACEFDYSGTQACKALKEEGYRVILANSNPATIMTDPNYADATYVEPLTAEILEKIIAKEKPDALLPTMGGQTALNISLTLARTGVLEKYGVALIGAKKEAIDKAEDREKFRDAMKKIGLECPKSRLCRSLDDALLAIDFVGLPAIIRPSYTLGGTGGGIAYNRDEFEKIVLDGLDSSPTKEVLVEESVLGWKEYEMEVVRDKNDNCIIVCSIENVDPMGIHTGDSITVAPALTLTDKEFQIMRNASISILREINVETGGSNVQFAVNPVDGRLVVIEMNPRVSRSSALASKATGFPIAKVAAKLAVGYTLDELVNDITGATPVSFEPTIDYVVTKIPRFTFEKFLGTRPLLTTSMKSVGEVMAIGRSFPESLQKALRSLETGLTGLNNIKIPGHSVESTNFDVLRAALGQPTPERLLVVAEAIRAKLAVEEIASITCYDPWFIDQIKRIVDAEIELKNHDLPNTYDGLLKLKQLGFSDERLAELTNRKVEEIRSIRWKHNLRPVYKRIDTCAAEFHAKTPYLYSCYETAVQHLEKNRSGPEDETDPTGSKKVIILGGGPNRIGQGIEFDYCCSHAAFSLSEAGFETIMVNCNPETVSTDYDTADRLYFEPLTVEDVIELVNAENKKGQVLGVIVQLGGQTPLKVAHDLQTAGIPILGTSPEAIDIAEDRELFKELIKKLKLNQPKNGIARDLREATQVANAIGFPVLIRPSYVLGGRAMEIAYDVESLNQYMQEAVKVSGENPVLIDAYLQDAIEVDVDALSDGEEVFVAGIMQHIEEAGIHSGDSVCSLPPFSLPPNIINELMRQTQALALALGVRGLMNVQYAIKDSTVFLLEVNPRASRTVPFVAKATGKPIAKIGARLMIGEKLSHFDLTTSKNTHVAVKSPVFPFARFPGVDVLLGPEMKSTGEVMGIDKDFVRAFIKSQLAAGTLLPSHGTVFISVKDKDKKAAFDLAHDLLAMGYAVVATRGTAFFLKGKGLDVDVINKVAEGRPHIVDAIKNGEIDLMFNTTEGKQSVADSYEIRRTALMEKIPYYTTLSGSRVAVQALRTLRSEGLEVSPLQFYSD